MRKDMEGLSSEQQFSTVSLIAAQINNEMDNRLKALENAADSAMQPMQQGPAAMQALIDQHTLLHTLFNGGIIAHGLDGTAIADYPASAQRLGGNYMFAENVATALKEGKASISRPLLDNQLKSPLIGLAVPIRNAQGKVIGSLEGVIKLGRPNFLDGIMASRYAKTGGYLLVDPQHRLIVTATDKSRIMEVQPAPGINPLIDRFINGYEGSAVIVNPLGVETLASAKGIPAAGWIMSAVMPTEEAFAPIRGMQQRMLIAMIFLSLMVGGLVWWMLRRQQAAMNCLTAWGIGGRIS
ncbi:cache domain-containing protein [Propionivibrio sp.]|uniref:cache domain-containing protein n=1 Tax=Propionivibrio sp. TaxID=2212460 RepID=UPI003BF3D207